MADSPYPELKKTHTMARRGRPWRDFKPPPSAPVWAIIQGFGSYWTLVAAVDLGVFDAVQRRARRRPTPWRRARVAGCTSATCSTRS